MTERHEGERQKDIVAVLKESGPTRSGPDIYKLVARRMGVAEVTRSLQTQLRKSLDGLCSVDRYGNPALIQKSRSGATNYFTLIEHTFSHQQLDSEEQELGRAFRSQAARLVLAHDPHALDVERKSFLESVALLAWKRVRCTAGDATDARRDQITSQYMVTRTGMSVPDLQQYVRSEATRIIDGDPWVPLAVVR